MEIISSSKTQTNTVEAVIRADSAEFEAAIEAVYLKKKKDISVGGFRKGKASRKMIEKVYGKNFFYQDAVNEMYPAILEKAADKLGLDVVAVPSVEVTEISAESGVCFKAQYIVKPEVNISDYKGLKLEKKIKTITENDVDDEIQRIRERNARLIAVTDRPAETGDTVNIDYNGTIDGISFEGGSAEHYGLTLGSGTFIPGFEEQIEGKNIGEEFDVNVTFPEDYHAEEYAGKAAIFRCKLHEIHAYEVPELDDEFVKDVSEFDTLEEYSADIRQRLTQAAAEKADSELDNNMATRISEKVEGEIPDVMYEKRVDDMLREWEYRNRSAGITLQFYLKYTGMSAEEFRESFRAPAEVQVKLRLGLEKIAEFEHIEVGEEEIERCYNEIAEQNNMSVERVKEVFSRKSAKEDLTVQKAFDFVKENAEITEVQDDG